MIRVVLPLDGGREVEIELAGAPTASTLALRGDLERRAGRAALVDRLSR